jgi:hypothetical protein
MSDLTLGDPSAAAPANFNAEEADNLEDVGAPCLMASIDMEDLTNTCAD